MEERPMSDYWFEQFLNEDKLMGSKCSECGALFVPPRAICQNCHGAKMEWIQMMGTGKLVAFTSIAVGPPAMVEEGYGRDNPYCTGVVELDESPRVVARIEDVDASNPENIKIGIPLKVKFLHRGEGEDLETVLAFNPL